MLDISPKLTTAPFAQASTMGWDTVFGITFDRVNRTIAKEGSFPGDFRQPAEGAASLSGTFDAWALSGGSGPKLQVTLNIPELTLDLGTTIVRRNVSIVIEASLDKFPEDLGKGYPKGAQSVAFRINTSNLMDDPVLVQEPTYPAITEAGHTQPSSANDGLTPADIQNEFFDWINDAGNLGKFTTTFATVNLNTRAAVDAFAWLDPTEATYAVQRTGGTEGGVLAVLCMTGGREAPSSWDVTADLIPNGAEAGFLLSKEMFLQNMLMTGLGLMFDDPQDSDKVWPNDYFELSDQGTRIMNTATLGIAEFEIEDKCYAASVEPGNFSAELKDTYLELKMDRFKHSFAKGWYDVYHDITLPAILALNPERTQMMLCPGSGEYDPEGEDLNPPTHNATVEKTDLAKGVEWTVFAIDLLLLLVAVGAATRGALQAGAQGAGQAGSQLAGNAANAAAGGAQVGAGGAGVVAGALQGVQSVELMGMRVYSAAFLGIIGAISGLGLIENLVEWIINQTDSPEATIPDPGIFAAKVMEPVTWPDSAGFELTSIQFNGGVQMGGIPTFADT